MNLSQLQRGALQQFKRYRGVRPNLISLLAQHWKIYVLLIAFALVGGWLLSSLGFINLVYLAAGLIGGAITRDIGLYRRFVETWPVTDSLLNWERLDDLLLGARAAESANRVE